MTSPTHGPRSPADRGFLLPSTSSHIPAPDEDGRHADRQALSESENPAVSTTKTLVPNKYILTRPIDMGCKSQRNSPVMTDVSASSTSAGGSFESVEEHENLKEVDFTEDPVLEFEQGSSVHINSHTISDMPVVAEQVGLLVPVLESVPVLTVSSLCLLVLF